MVSIRISRLSPDGWRGEELRCAVKPHFNTMESPTAGHLKCPDKIRGLGRYEATNLAGRARATRDLRRRDYPRILTRSGMPLLGSSTTRHTGVCSCTQAPSNRTARTKVANMTVA